MAGHDGIPPLPESLAGKAWIRYCALKFLLRSGKGYVRNSLANAIKRAIGRPPYLDETETLFRAIVLGKLGLRDLPKITMRGQPTIGVGNQVRIKMCAINFARALRIPYAHTPFHEIQFPDRPMHAWAALWEEEFNLGAGELRAPDNETAALDFTWLAGRYVKRFGHENLFAMFDLTAEEFRRKYYLDKRRRNNPVLNVGVHVRRGDVTLANKIGRWTELSDVAYVVRRVQTLLADRNIAHRVLIFSQGKTEDFRELQDLGAEFFLDSDVDWTMREMIEADILIMGKGWFSYIAALISDGIRLYDPWLDVPPMGEWLVIGPGGKFDETRFARELAQKSGTDSGLEKSAGRGIGQTSPRN